MNGAEYKAKKGFIFLSLALTVFLVPIVKAHCPLCTIGAGAAAGGAALLGISKLVIGLFMGAFAMSMGMWLSRIIKKKYLPFQKTLIILIVFLTTLLPLLPIFSVIGPLYIPFIGEYGLTYAINYSLATSLIGALIVLCSPSLSKKLTSFRKGKKFRFQGIIITFALLIIAGIIIQVLI